MTHTQLSECSVRTPIRKGREGNWKGGEVLGTTSIDLTVGAESPPEAWMDLDDLNLLDDDKRHRVCFLCYTGPRPVPMLATGRALCGKRWVKRYPGGWTVASPPTNACADCIRLAGHCLTCGY